MGRFQNCCCCIPLKTGAYVLGVCAIIELIFGVSSIIIACISDHKIHGWQYGFIDPVFVRGCGSTIFAIPSCYGFYAMYENDKPERR